MEQEFKYFAFISYNSRDTEWGKRVQRKRVSQGKNCVPLHHVST